MAVVKAKTRPQLIGMTLELSGDEVSHLSTVLHDYMRLMKEHRNVFGGKQWPWVEALYEQVEAVRRV